jgi:hypothetical protein
MCSFGIHTAPKEYKQIVPTKKANLTRFEEVEMMSKGCIVCNKQVTHDYPGWQIINAKPQKDLRHHTQDFEKLPQMKML